MKDDRKNGRWDGMVTALCVSWSFDRRVVKFGRREGSAALGRLDPASLSKTEDQLSLTRGQPHIWCR